MNLSSDVVKQIYATLGNMIEGNREILKILGRYSDACRVQDLDVMNSESNALKNAFTVVGDLSKKNALLMISVGIEGDSQYSTLVGALTGKTKEIFQARVDLFLSEVEETQEELGQREEMLGTQVAIIGEVIGEMNLEISV